MKFERNAILAFIAVMAALGALVSDQYLLHIGILILFYATLGISLNMVVGYVGEFSLGHTAFLGIGAYTAAIMSSKLGVPMWATVPLAGLISAVFGYLIGAVTLRLQGPFFVIVTLAFAEVLRLVADNWVWLTNGPMGIAGISGPEMLKDFSNQGAKEFYFYVALLIFAFAMFIAWRFVYSNAGRAAVAIRENRYVAQSVGIKPFTYAMLAFVLGSLLAGLAGGFYAHYISFVGSEVFKFSFMITMIIVVLMGGKGTLVGPIVGAVLVTLLEEYLREAKDLRMSIFGLIVMLIVLFLPNGLMGFLHQRRERYEGALAPENQKAPAARQAGQA